MQHSTELSYFHPTIVGSLQEYHKSLRKVGTILRALKKNPLQKGQQGQHLMSGILVPISAVPTDSYVGMCQSRQIQQHGGVPLGVPSVLFGCLLFIFPFPCIVKLVSLFLVFIFLVFSIFIFLFLCLFICLVLLISPSLRLSLYLSIYLSICSCILKF